ncbi:MAG: aminoglycoside phosphotransferase family protein [Actinobacteria bacterium]|nr:aminoglycoside phosphotransferase family protein [Actinomycetota bacterium]
MTTAAAVLAQAVRSGLVRASAALSGEVTVTRIEGSNPVLRLAEGGRPVAFVKGTGPAARLNGEDTVARERAVVSRLVASGTVRDELLPGTPDELWLTPVGGRSMAELAGDVATLSEGFAALGRTLAGLHRVPVGPGAPAMSLPWPMLETTPSHMETAKYHEVPTLVITTARELGDVAAGARRAWRPVGWAHGDVSATNVLVDADGAHLIDWESAGLGDPSWDLAGARIVAEHAASGWSELAMRRLLSAYRAADGPAAEPNPALWCVRLLVAAYQLAVGVLVVGGTPDADGGVTRLLDQAREAGAHWRECAHG